MGKATSKSGRRFCQEQYDRLKRCSEKKDMTEWNEWRKNNSDKDVLLEGANLFGFHLEGAFLNKALVRGNRGEWYTFPRKAGVTYHVITDKEVKDSEASVYLAMSDLRGAYLEGALFYEAHLESANLSDAHLEGADFWHTYLAGAQFHTSIFDGSTLVWKCIVSRGTNFDGVGLDNVCIDAGTKQLLEYNMRRLNWKDWYKKHPELKWVVKPFWLMSDYGRSTGRIIITFFGLAVIFANIYYYWARMAPPGVVSHLLVDETGAAVPWWLVPLRALYFSIVTMTTLGFGDMYARGQSIFGHLLLMLQVLLGYVLLGALVTRFAVLFTAGGPAGKFVDE